jgi:ribosome-associated protein
VANDGQLLAGTCAHLADERKADDIVVLDVGDLAFFTGYFVIATGRNERQIDAIAAGIRSQMKKLGRPIVGVEGDAASGWILIDLAEAIVHLFSPDARAMYDLELLWGQAPRIDWRGMRPEHTGTSESDA